MNQHTNLDDLRALIMRYQRQYGLTVEEAVYHLQRHIEVVSYRLQSRCECLAQDLPQEKVS